MLVHQFKNFSKAANKANISQPSLSISIKKAEESLNTKLFTRGSKLVETTSQGRIVVKMAKQIIENYDKGIQELDSLIANKSGNVSFGIDSFMSKTIMQDFIPLMNKKYPGIRYNININPWHKLVEALQRGELDFAIVVYSSRADFAQDVFAFEEMYVPKAAYFTRKDHPLSKIRKPDSRSLNQYPWVGNVVSPTWAKWALEVTDISTEKMQEIFLAKVNDYDTTIDLVQSNNAVGGHVYNELLPHVKQGKVSIIDFDWLVPHPENIGTILSLKKKALCPNSKLFVKEIQEYSQQWKDEKV